ncbi:BTB/POZ domain-containing protein 6-B-like [Contarinia nasturtii]|uniref:BTB/POZ domain-containing protein 6-B-like n=1 Tax=Contarinia nasturtii TaxID=265458 RepID=UPI0012D3AC02|nr:BTB/POZ domain-containing protein 6-B-like [Contarinia nasturtii]
MAKQSTLISYKNVLVWRGCEKLYLDERTADVFFIFESTTENVEKVPGHKYILSSISEKFDAMFYGPNKTDSDVIMDNTPVSSEAFKQFLQFFYRHTVNLSMEHVAEVMDLSKEHMLHDCITACIDLCKESLSTDNICLGYELAILFEQEDLKKFCEEKINEHPTEFFQSNGFLLCQPNLLRYILQLGSFKCDESLIFDGCMAWAKAACIQKGLYENDMHNIRSELGDLFYEIRFGDMTLEMFNARVDLYEGLFSMEEFRDIIRMIGSKDYQPPKFNRNLRNRKPKQPIEKQLLCDRIDRSEIGLTEYRKNCVPTVFSTNRLLYLKDIYCGTLFDETNTHAVCTMQVGELIDVFEEFRSVNYCCQINLNSVSETKIELPTPVVIKPDAIYGIVLQIGLNHKHGHKYRSCLKLKHDVQLDDGIAIRFYDIENDLINNGPMCDLVTKLNFERQNEDYAMC